MLHKPGHESDQGAHGQYDDDVQRGRTGRTRLSPPGLTIPKNRSTGNLTKVADEPPERSRIRFSLDAGSMAAEYDALARSPIMTEHDHGMGLSGLRRIRQHPSVRTSTLPSAAASRSSSVGLPRTGSTTSMLLHHTSSLTMSPGPSSPSFTEDLSRFPSESLHSFSFAHQSEDALHNRQNAMKRSLEFMKDRMGWSMTSNAASSNAAAAIASAQARVTGDVEMQNMLDLLAKAQLVGASNLPNPDPTVILGPLTGPAQVSGENPFEKSLVPRTASPESFLTPAVSPTATRGTEPTVIEEEEEKKLDAPPGTDAQQRSSRQSLDGADSTESSRTPTNESGTTQKTSPPQSRRPSVLKRTMTDTIEVSMQHKLMDALAQPYVAAPSAYQDALISPNAAQFPAAMHSTGALGAAVHGHSSRWVPAAQAIFTTQAKAPWTILAANDLACLVFGVTKGEVRKMGILEVVQEERRAWLEKKLQGEDTGDAPATIESKNSPSKPVAAAASILGSRAGGITAKLLSKPNSRSQPQNQRRAVTVHSGDPKPPKPGGGHRTNKSRGVLLCGDVVPIQKRNGATGSASLWVKEKRVGLIWVLEEIHEDVAIVSLGEDGMVDKLSGATEAIWGSSARPGLDIGNLIPRVPRQGIDPRFGELDYAQVNKRRYFTCKNGDSINIPATVEQVRGQSELRVSSFPHIAGIVVVSPETLTIKSSNSVFCGALFGYEKPDGLPINNLIPQFDKILQFITEEDRIELVDGIVVPEHSFRKASAFMALREGKPDAAASFFRPDGLLARHRDGSELKVDVQLRVVNSEKKSEVADESPTTSDEERGMGGRRDSFAISQFELVYAFWITYSRHLHATRNDDLGLTKSLQSDTSSPLHQPSPGQTQVSTPLEITSEGEEPKKEPSAASTLTKSLKHAALSAAARLTGSSRESQSKAAPTPAPAPAPAAEPHKKTIEDFVVLEDMGQGAYGQVKLARYKNDGRKVVLKYVTKRRILVDTWTRDRRLGTVPLEIHVLDYLRRNDLLRHPNIVEMDDFFEDDVNYYIEMVPHGLPGMDLFDYIELRSNMQEDECRSIFVQVARAIHHLHTKANVVHRDIKDENVILDGEGNIKLIDFGSAAYIKSGPFDVFVGTIDYAAPEVLAGKPYGGKEQDVWALGILLYTIIYKENPFYSIDEIMDRDLRVPYTISDDSIDLVRHMLDRDVAQRYDITQVMDHPWCRAAGEKNS